MPPLSMKVAKGITMWRRTMRSASTFIWVMITLFACRGIAQSMEEPELKIEIFPASEKVLVGESIDIDLTIRNASATQMVLFRSLHPDGFLVQFNISNESGELVYASPSVPHEETAEFLKDVIALESGYYFGRRYRFERAKILGQDGPPFAPGKYTVKASYINSRRVKPNMPTGKWVSNEVQVTVTGAR